MAILLGSCHWILIVFWSLVFSWFQKVLGGWEAERLEGWEAEMLRGWTADRLRGSTAGRLGGWAAERLRGWEAGRLRGWYAERLRSWAAERQADAHVESDIWSAVPHPASPCGQMRWVIKKKMLKKNVGFISTNEAQPHPKSPQIYSGVEVAN